MEIHAFFSQLHTSIYMSLCNLLGSFADVLQCVAVCCSVLQCVTVCYGICNLLGSFADALQCVAVCYGIWNLEDILGSLVER